MEWTFLVRLTIGLIFFVSVSAKLLRGPSFADSIRQYEILPVGIVRPVAALVVAGEAFVAISLLLGIRVRLGLIVAAALLALFAGATSLTLTRNRPTDCGCLGGLVKLRLGWVAVGANLVLSGAAVGAVARAASDGPTLAGGGISIQTAGLLWACGVLLAAVYWLAAYAQSVAQLVDGSIAREGSR